MIIKLISFVIVFTVIVLAHEMGHFIFSRIAGIKVLELGLGLGPKLAGVIRKGTKYTLNLLPVGGFVRIAGLDEDTSDKDESFLPKESYLNKKPGQKFLSIFGGPLFNMLLAILILYFVFLFNGAPKGISNEIAMVTPGLEAQRVGIMPGDKIISANVQKDKLTIELDKLQRKLNKILNNNEEKQGTVAQVTKTDIYEIIQVIHNNPGKNITLIINRDKKKIEFTVTPKLNNKSGIGLVGISFKQIYVKTNIISAFGESLNQVIGISIFVLYTLGYLLIGKISVFDLAGPVGIAQFTGQVAGEGIVSLLSFTAFLSINLGLVNLLPIPALDGGRLVFIVIEWIRKKAINAELENKIHQVGLVILLAFMALVTIHDILRLVGR